MTEAIKQWIKDQAVKGLDAFSSSQVKMIGFSMGLEKEIEIAEGFAEWVDDNYLQEVKGQWYSLGLKKDERAEFFTTSQLLEKYLETLNNDKA